MVVGTGHATVRRRVVQRWRPRRRGAGGTWKGSLQVEGVEEMAKVDGKKAGDTVPGCVSATVSATVSG